MAPPRRLPPLLATRVSAEAGSGPEQGLRTGPSTPTRIGALPREPPETWVEAQCAPRASGVIQWVNRAFQDGTRSTRAKPIGIGRPVAGVGGSVRAGTIALASGMDSMQAGPRMHRRGRGAHQRSRRGPASAPATPQAATAAVYQSATYAAEDSGQQNA